ncbi:hypothetical protein PKOR_09400 [Pontibacter korlensis]|uniref:Uncharacterized protein n=1 Tax=Pontibacter korlensis TaxID=400092 RepID=A0A0E3ZG66_9BACT|nr:hypothetical protein [Pontibacter korlensis]AKD03298.1 hypothetical protein PKOR_09400 [Pontibacter korlensis]
MKSLILYGREELKSIGKADNLIRLGLLIVSIFVGANKYGSLATAETIFVFYSAISLFAIAFSGRKIFTQKNLRKSNSIEQGRLFYHLISIIIVLSGLLYFQSRTAYIFTAAFTIIFCFVAVVSMLLIKPKR